MTKTKKTAAAVAVAFGLTATATGSYAVTAPDGSGDAAIKTAERATVKVDRGQSTEADRAGDQNGERRKCINAKKMRKIRVFMTQKQAMRKLPKPTRKSQSSGLRFRYFNACTSSLDTDFNIVLKKKGHKKNRTWRVYQVDVYWS